MARWLQGLNRSLHNLFPLIILLVCNEGKMKWKCPTILCNLDARFQLLFMMQSFVLHGQPLEINVEHGRMGRSSLNT